LTDQLRSNDHNSKEKYFQNDTITGLSRTAESSIVILDLLHVNAVQLCCLSSTTNEGSEHEIAITTSVMIMLAILGSEKMKVIYFDGYE
jgi:hypothetical protein